MNHKNEYDEINKKLKEFIKLVKRIKNMKINDKIILVFEDNTEIKIKRIK